ncbi:MAG: hypothetical protein JSR91_08525 [Proteobacteria bacterium]|nr:hypothetical protein [Pseudomonadota bacterium]
MLTGRAPRAAPDIGRSGYSEHLLVWSWRRIVEGRIRCPVMAHEFADACGQDGPRAFLALCTFLRALGAASRRQLTLCASNPFDITADERQILTLLAAAQADDHVLFQAHLRWLARPQQRQELQVTAQALAALFKANNLPLALPPLGPPGGRERPHAVTPVDPR